MKKDDVVVCVDNLNVDGTVEYLITIGSRYTVYRSYAEHITIIGDNDLPARYGMHRFKLLSKIREDKLDSIISKG